MNIELGDAIEKVFDNFKKVTPLLLTIAIISGLVLFLPDGILSRMALDAIPNVWKVIIGIIFLLTSVLTIVIWIRSIVKPIAEKVRIKQLKRRMRSKYLQLSKEKKAIICELVKKIGEPVELNSSMGIVRYLESNMYITRTQNIGTFDSEFSNGIILPYTVQGWVMELYDREPDLFSE